MAAIVDEPLGAAEPREPMLPDLYRIDRLVAETYDTFTLELTAQTPGALLNFSPGQFNMLYTFGVGEVPISISGDTARPTRLIHTIRNVGTVTRAMAKLRVGDTVGVRGPFGTTWPVGEAVGKDVVIVAGGIGLAPLRPAIYHLIHNRKLYNRVTLLYGARTPKDALFMREWKKWQMKGVDVFTTVDRSSETWAGNVGVVTNLIAKAPFASDRTIAMTCGPEVMMRFTVQTLLNRGVSDRNLYVSMERNMKCGIGYCGHCQMGREFVCKDGPVFSYSEIATLFNRWEV